MRNALPLLDSVQNFELHARLHRTNCFRYARIPARGQALRRASPQGGQVLPDQQCLTSFVVLPNTLAADVLVQRIDNPAPDMPVVESRKTYSAARIKPLQRGEKAYVSALARFFILLEPHALIVLTERVNLANNAVDESFVPHTKLIFRS